MAPSQLEAFFTHGDVLCGVPPSQRAAQRGDDSEAPRDELLYLHAVMDAGLTSLLLQYGFTRARAGKNVVLLLCGDSARPQQRPVVVPLQPCLRCGVPAKTGMDNEVWRRIQIKYIKTSAELQHFACSLHLMRDKSSVLLVDSFERFFIEQSLGSVYQTLALLFEARRYMAASTGVGEVVLAGDANAFLLRDHPRLHRWCRFLQISSDGDELVLHEEIDAERQDDDEGGENGGDDDEQNDVAIRFEFSPPGSSAPDGSFRLLEVIYRHTE